MRLAGTRSSLVFVNRSRKVAVLRPVGVFLSSRRLLVGSYELLGL